MLKSESYTAKSESKCKSLGSQTKTKFRKIGLKFGLEAHLESSHYITGIAYAYYFKMFVILGDHSHMLL